MRLIDAEAYENKLNRYCDENCKYTKKERYVMCDACELGIAFEILEDTPATDVRENVQPQWIPCSERLPATEEKVLCCTVTRKGIKNIVIGYFYRDESSGGWACGMNSNVKAWMPLPEPWKGGENE